MLVENSNGSALAYGASLRVISDPNVRVSLYLTTV